MPLTNIYTTKQMTTNLREKPRYELLDGLRGVAALIVIWYHIFEGFASSPYDQMLNHGYLAVDFFFVLSGFVVGYAYNDRWGKMSTGGFFKRRLIRLHPMVVMGALIGVVAFIIQGCTTWSGEVTPLSMVMLSMLMAMLMIPACPNCGAEVRGNGEMFPLNGPAWSLLFEYIGNILYALALRRLSTKALATLVVVMGGAIATFAMADGSGFGHLGVGWTMAEYNFVGGMLRMGFAFSMGLLLQRQFVPRRIKGAFWLCSALLVAALVMPYAGDESLKWINGLYDTICVVGLFPLIVWVAASGSTTDRASTGVCNFLGEISYPLYIIHYPSMYLFYYHYASWSATPHTFAQVWYIALAVVVGNIVAAWLLLRFYDKPVRAYLTRKFIQKADSAQ